jgi:hypothetical protein
LGRGLGGVSERARRCKRFDSINTTDISIIFEVFIAVKIDILVF